MGGCGSLKPKERCTADGDRGRSDLAAKVQAYDVGDVDGVCLGGLWWTEKHRKPSTHPPDGGLAAGTGGVRPCSKTDLQSYLPPPPSGPALINLLTPVL